MLYEDGGTLTLAADDDDTPTFDSSVFDDVADLIYRAGGFDINQIKDPKVRKLILATVAAINRGVDAHLPTDVPDTLRYALEENTFVFSGFKTFHAMREIGLSLVNDKGEIKPYAEFQEDVLKLNNRYNRNYLYAEYKHAVGTSQMAAKWAAMEQDGDRYLLQYRTAEDNRVREDHAAMNGITLPPSDPFWDKYYPPNGWGCRCTAVQVRRGKYAESDPAHAMLLGDNSTEAAKQQMFRFNPGKQMKLFPPKHPYYKAPTTAAKVITKVSKAAQAAQHQQQITGQLPTTLPQATRDAIVDNILKLEKALKAVCGAPMTVSQADRQSANPKWEPKFIADPNGTYVDKAGNRYRKNSKYREAYNVNCQTCTPAYLLRLRGLDIIAKGCTPNSQSEYLSKGLQAWECWLNADGTPAKHTAMGDWYKAKGYNCMDKDRYKEFFEETTKEEGVYALSIGWRGGGGHMTVLQRRADGALVYIEPQHYESNKGEQRPINELCDSGDAFPHECRGIMRIDDKIFNMKFASIFRKTPK
jgi:SPP1 gp7 family putative phage head morphogenesis protein